LKKASERVEEGAGSFPMVTWLYWTLAVSWAFLIHRLVGGPSPGGGTDFFWTFLINGGHAVLFSIQALLLGLALGKNRWLLAVVLAVAYGGMEEWVQAYLPDRSASFFDWATDGFGAMFGIEVLLSRYPLPKGRLFRLILWVVLASLSALGDTLWG
jgi:hypothetical protein